MITYQIAPGTTDVSVYLRCLDATTGAPKTDVVYNSSGIDLKYRRTGAAATDITEATLAALTTAHTDGGFLHVGSGWYRLDLPDAAVASGVADCMVFGSVTGGVFIGCLIQLQGAVNKIYSDTTHIDSDATRVESKAVQIYSDTTAIHTQTTTAASKATQIYSDTTIVTSKTTQLYSDTTRIHSDTTKVESDTAHIESDAARAESKAVQIYSDTTIVTSKTTQIYSDTTKIHSDTTVIEAAGAGTAPDVLVSTTIASINSQTSFTLTAGSSDNDAYNGMAVIFQDQSTSAQKWVCFVSDYVGSTKTVTLESAPGFTIATGDNVAIMAAGGSSSLPVPAALSTAQASQVTKAASKATQIYSDTTIATSKATQIYSDTTAAATSLTNIYSDTTRVHSDTTHIDSDTTRTESKALQIYSDTTIVTSKTTQLYSDTTAIHTQTTTAASKATQIYSDTTIIASKSVQIYSDTTKIHSDTTALDGKADAIIAVTDKLDTTLEADDSDWKFTAAALAETPVGEGGGLDAAGIRNAIGLDSANLDQQLAAISTVTEKLDDTLEDQGGGTYGFTEEALQEAPSGGGGSGPTAEEIADAVWDEAQSAHETPGTFGAYLDSAVSGVSTGGVSASDIADAVWDEALSGHASAGTAGERLSRIPNAAAGGNGGLPTVDANNRVAGIAGTINTLDGLDTAQDAQHSATQSAIGGLNNVSSGDVQTAAAAALTAYDPPTNAEMVSRTLAAASYATAANQTAIEGKVDTLDNVADAIKAKTDDLEFDEAGVVASTQRIGATDLIQGGTGNQGYGG